MRVITWNIRRAREVSNAWDVIKNLDPDVVLLQEVVGMPREIIELFDIRFEKAVNKNGQDQKFGTAILVKGKIKKDLELLSEHDWVNKELKHFSGNLISCIAKLSNSTELNIISAYSPAWPVDPERIKNIDVSDVKLKLNPKVWMTEILWSALKNSKLDQGNWIIGGDLNSSETFDSSWGSGNKEVLDRMYSLGLSECLREYNGKLIPTFRNPREGKVAHQLDHLFVTNKIFDELKECKVGNEFNVFEESISDHLPIIADFK